MPADCLAWSRMIFLSIFQISQRFSYITKKRSLRDLQEPGVALVSQETLRPPQKLFFQPRQALELADLHFLRHGPVRLGEDPRRNDATPAAHPGPSARGRKKIRWPARSADETVSFKTVSSSLTFYLSRGYHTILRDGARKKIISARNDLSLWNNNSG